MCLDDKQHHMISTPIHGPPTKREENEEVLASKRMHGSLTARIIAYSCLLQEMVALADSIGGSQEAKAQQKISMLVSIISAASSEIISHYQLRGKAIQKGHVYRPGLRIQSSYVLATLRSSTLLPPYRSKKWLQLLPRISP